MRKGWIIALVIIFVILGLCITFVLMVSSFMEREPSVKDHSVLIINLKGELPESVPVDVMSRIFQATPMTFHALMENIEKATIDKRISGIFLKIDSPQIGWAKVQELQKKLARFKKKGKFIIAYGEIMNELNYACALPADKIYLPEEGSFEFNGFVASAMFLKDMFNKLGIEPEVENIGKYKSFGDMLKRSSATDAQKEEMNSLLDETLNHFSRMVEKFRKIPPEKTKALLDKGLTSPQEAMSNGLIDGIRYLDEVENILKKKNGQARKNHLTFINDSRYRRVHIESLTGSSGNQIALIFAVGSIVRGNDTFSPIFGRSMGSNNLIKAIREAKRNRAVKAIILRVDSPGGDALASDLMWRELRIANRIKPVIASMSDVAASGGYYISMGCRKIVADPGTITGSIGVVSAAFNMAKLYNKFLGIHFETLKRGKWADMLDTSRPMTPEEWNRFRAHTRTFYEHFVKKAALSRHRKFYELEKIAQGRVWSGQQALSIGLVDQLGGLDKAIEVARKEAGIAPGKKVRIVVYPHPKKLIDIFLENLTQTRVFFYNSKLSKTLHFLGRFALAPASTPLAIMPYDVNIH